MKRSYSHSDLWLAKSMRDELKQFVDSMFKASRLVEKAVATGREKDKDLALISLNESESFARETGLINPNMWVAGLPEAFQPAEDLVWLFALGNECKREKGGRKPLPEIDQEGKTVLAMLEALLEVLNMHIKSAEHALGL